MIREQFRWELLAKERGFVRSLASGQRAQLFKRFERVFKALFRLESSLNRIASRSSLPGGAASQDEAVMMEEVLPHIDSLEQIVDHQDFSRVVAREPDLAPVDEREVLLMESTSLDGKAHADAAHAEHVAMTQRRLAVGQPLAVSERPDVGQTLPALAYLLVGAAAGAVLAMSLNKRA